MYRKKTALEVKINGKIIEKNVTNESGARVLFVRYSEKRTKK